MTLSGAFRQSTVTSKNDSNVAIAAAAHQRHPCSSVMNTPGELLGCRTAEPRFTAPATIESSYSDSARKTTN
jgi:hypothetical protein